MNEEKELRIAAANGDLNKVKYLLNQGVDEDAQNKNGMTALMYAAAYGHLNIVKHLVEEDFADVTIKCNTGLQAVHYTMVHDHFDINIYMYLIHAEIKMEDENERKIN